MLKFYVDKGSLKFLIKTEPEKVIDVIFSIYSQIEILKKENKELNARLNLNSNNSSKPPFSDGYQKKSRKNINSREKSNRKSGGQTGHTGNTLKMIEKPDNIVEHKPKDCSYCGIDVSNHSFEKIEKRQVFDITMPQVVVTEHQTYS